jgi:hypothetical protein
MMWWRTALAGFWRTRSRLCSRCNAPLRLWDRDVAHFTLRAPRGGLGGGQDHRRAHNQKYVQLVLPNFFDAAIQKCYEMAR